MSITPLIFYRDLCVVVLTSPKTGELEGFFQLGLTPVTHQFFIPLQCAGQILRFTRHGDADRFEMLDLLP